MQSFERLKAWQACQQLALSIYEETRFLPEEEDAWFKAHLRGVALNAASAIANGRARGEPEDFRAMLDLAGGFLGEIGCLLQLARDLGILAPDICTRLEIDRDHASKLTWGLYRRVKESLTGPGKKKAGSKPDPA
jgi:four helix bundle protein